MNDLEFWSHSLGLRRDIFELLGSIVGLMVGSIIVKEPSEQLIAEMDDMIEFAKGDEVLGHPQKLVAEGYDEVGSGAVVGLTLFNWECIS